MGELHRLFKLRPAGKPDVDLETTDGARDSMSVGPQTPSGLSLEFTLMAAVRHAECGEWQAMVTAVADALWVAHTGQHEQMSDGRVITLLRSLAGLEWNPPTQGEAA